jgi:hypothetical protein
MQQQEDKNAALPARPKRDGVIPVSDLQRSQQAKEHASTSGTDRRSARGASATDAQWVTSGREMGANGQRMTGARNRPALAAKRRPNATKERHAHHP